MSRITTALPANYGGVTMPRVYNLQYPGDALVVSTTVAGATSYEVRDFTGTVIDSGTWTGTSKTIGTAGAGVYLSYGWYTLRLLGPDRGDGAYGVDYGTCRFVIAQSSTTCPIAPLRSSAPAYLSDGLTAPLAHGLFSLSGFRFSLLVPKIGIRQEQDNAFLASGTTLTANMTGGGFGGATTSASETFVAHTVVGDATGMAPSAGYTTVATSTNGTVTLKVYRKFGAQSPGTITVTTTNAAQHTLSLFEIQGIDDTALNNGKLIATAFAGSGTSITMTADLTTLAPGTTDYYIGSVVGVNAQVQANSVVGLLPQQGTQNQTLTHDAYGGGQAHSVTYNYAVSHVYAGIIFAFKAVSTYAGDLTNVKNQLTYGQAAWGQYATPGRPRQVTIQIFGAGPSTQVFNYSNSVKQVVTDTLNYAPGFISGYTARNEPQGTYSAPEAATFSAAVHSVAGAKALGPDYVTHPVLNDDLGAQADAGIFTSLDGFSFHSYNMNSGDLYGNVRPSLETLAAVLKAKGVFSRPKFMTEGGHDTTWYPGNLRIHSAGQSFVLFNMALELILGVPYENVNHYYDQPAGYAQVTTWASAASGPYAGWPLHRQFALEVAGKTVDQVLDFADGNFMYLGGIWKSAVDGKRTAAVVGASKGVPSLSAYVSGAGAVVVDAFGNVLSSPAAGQFTLPVSDLPIYVRLPAGVTFGVRPPFLGRNLLASPYKPQATDSAENQPSINMLKMVDDSRVSPYAYGSGDASSTGPGSNYKTSVNTFPRTISITTPLWNLKSDTIVVTTGYPWQAISTPLDFDIQTLTAGTWTTRGTYVQNVVAVRNFDYYSDTMVDTYTNPQHLFVASVPAGTVVSGVRLVIRSGSLDMNLDPMSAVPPTTTSLGITPSVSIRSIEAYNSLAATSLPLL